VTVHNATIVRAAAITAALTAVGSFLGLIRDLLLARWFGATGSTDAFLVAWTVPETVSPLLVEGAPPPPAPAWPGSSGPPCPGSPPR
jgi:putative peptidoglycan lipid II flippase